MTIAQGVKKVVSYKKQSGLGVPASGGSGQELRRVTSTINLTKDTYQSNEIRSDQQIADFRPYRPIGSIKALILFTWCNRTISMEFSYKCSIT